MPVQSLRGYAAKTDEAADARALTMASNWRCVCPADVVMRREARGAPFCNGE